MLFPELRYDKTYFGKYTEDKNGVERFIPLGRKVKVKEVYEIMETEKQNLVLQIQCNNEHKCIDVSRSRLNRKNMDYFQDFGFDCYEHSITQFIKSIHQQEVQMPINVKHTGVGWYEYRGEVCYRSEELIVRDESQLKSSYYGNADVALEGNEEEYFNMIQKCVIGYVPAEFAIVAGASAIVNAFFTKEVNHESLILNFYNDSSKGKSIIAQLAASISSNPSFNHNPYMTTWNSTPNFIAGILRNNFGVCMVIDEGSLVGSKDLSNIFYMLASGKEKGRLDQNLSVRPSANWNTTIISTSEGSLLDESNHNEGLRVRVFEFGNVIWTKDAETADEIKRCIQDNYGFIGKKIAQYLVNIDYKEAKEAYLKEVSLYLDTVGKDNFNSLTSRIAKKMGILLYTVELINCVCNLELDKKGILEFLVLHQHKLPSKDIADRAFECILEQVTIHHNKFYRKISGKYKCSPKLESKPKNLIWGCINEKKIPEPEDSNTKTKKRRKKEEKMYREIVFVRNALIDLLKEQGFTNPQVVLQKMRDKGLLDAEKNKLIRRRAIMPGDSEISTYVIVDKQSDLEESRKIEITPSSSKEMMIEATEDPKLTKILED